MKDFLEDKFFPFWLEYGVDEIGGFQERLKTTLKPHREENKKRVLVQFRQCFVFAMAFELTGKEDYLRNSHRGLEFALTHYWDEEKSGFIHARDVELEVLSANRNLYDHAFALFSMAHYYKVTKSEDILEWIGKTHNFIQAKFKKTVGYSEYLDENNCEIPSEREQNPHMHLLEAYLALYEVLENEEYLNCAKELLDLFTNKMVDEKGGVVEFFTEDFEKYDPVKGNIIEPGHCFEWAWLLGEYERLSGNTEYRDTMEKVYSFGYDFGWDTEFGGIYNEVNRDGEATKTAKRIWPETEALKAHLCLYRIKQDEKYLERAKAQKDFTLKYRLNENNSWKEHLSRDLKDETDLHPSTTAYHLLMGFLEWIKNE